MASRALSLPATATATFVVDMQVYFLDPMSSFGRCCAASDPEAARDYFGRLERLVLPNVHRLVASTRAAGARVIFTEFGSSKTDGSDMPPWAQRHNRLAASVVGEPMYPHFNDPSCRVHPSIAPNVGERVIAKCTSGVLPVSSIDEELRAVGVTHAVVAGVATDVCVAHIARELSDRGFTTVVVEDASATPDMELHAATLKALDRSFARVVSTADVLDALPGHA